MLFRPRTAHPFSMFLKPLALSLALVSGLWIYAPLPTQAQNIIDFEKGDTDMARAVAQARKSLDPMLTRLMGSGTKAPDTFLLKVSFPVSDGGHEIIWVRNITRDGTAYFGRLDNKPRDIKGAREGSKISFALASVEDWSWDGPDGLLYGNYTTRVMLPLMSPKNSAYLKSILSPHPVPK